jgi:hypothetical protein
MQIVQLVGAVLILLAFTAIQTGRMRPDRLMPTVLNLVGAIMLAASALSGEQWGFLMLNGAWASIAAWSLLRKVLLLGESNHLPDRVSSAYTVLYESRWSRCPHRVIHRLDTLPMRRDSSRPVESPYLDSRL